MTMPQYPHAFSDDELMVAVEQLARSLGPRPHINDVMRTAPLIEIGQAELQIRATRALRESIEVFRDSSAEASRTLNTAIAELKSTSEIAAKRIQVLTGFLVVLTLALLGATIALIVTSG